MEYTVSFTSDCSDQLSFAVNSDSPEQVYVSIDDIIVSVPYHILVGLVTQLGEISFEEGTDTDLDEARK